MMKRIILGSAIMLMVGCNTTKPQVVLKEAPAPIPVRKTTRSFEGFGKKFYTPTTFDLSVAVISKDNDIHVVSEKHFSILDEIKKYLKTVENSEITINPAKVGIEKGQYDKIKKEYNLIHTFNSGITIRCRNISMLPAMQVKLIELGVNNVKDPAMFTENSHSIQNDARKLAITDAEAKVKFLQKELGWKSYKIIDIKLQTSRYSQYNSQSSHIGSRAGSSKNEQIGATAHISANVEIIVEIVH